TFPKETCVFFGGYLCTITHSGPSHRFVKLPALEEVYHYDMAGPDFRDVVVEVTVYRDRERRNQLAIPQRFTYRVDKKESLLALFGHRGGRNDQHNANENQMLS